MSFNNKLGCVITNIYLIIWLTTSTYLYIYLLESREGLFLSSTLYLYNLYLIVKISYVTLPCRLQAFFSFNSLATGSTHYIITLTLSFDLYMWLPSFRGFIYFSFIYIDTNNWELKVSRAYRANIPTSKSQTGNILGVSGIWGVTVTLSDAPRRLCWLVVQQG